VDHPVATAPPEPRLRWLGQKPYEPVFAAMRAFTEARHAETPDEFWCLEHEPVFTQGQTGKPEHVLTPGDIPVIASDRGGQITYHGPGQLVIYPLLDVQRLGLGVRPLVNRLEQAVIAWLATHGITAHALREAPGIYVGEAKIASLGLRIRRGCSYHGLAVNLVNDLEPFTRINPCGRAGQPMTRLADFAPAPRPSAAAPGLLRHLLEALKLPHRQPLWLDESPIQTGFMA
jgi:lipoyl(octanoyl) transferase